ncbi:MAG: SDR family oxidoreductase, partial [Chloroflexia bacterium]|nr:SDR family oxidoreductase [Chloroflexia bacterium]
TSRLKVSEELAKGTVPVTTLRAAIIIGSGSASFEILKHLVKNSPFLLLPKWAYTNCQPISIRDIIKYLIGVMEITKTKGKTYDIGGATTLSYVEMLKVFSGILNKKNLYVKTFLSNYTFYGYVASLLTPVPAQIVMALFESAKNEVVCLNNDIKEVLKFQPLSYQEAIVNALDREEQDKISTRWSDAYPPAHELAIKLHEINRPEYISTHTLATNKLPENLFKSICKVGGKDGWFNNNWMWRMRGMIDRVLMGVGTSRGRKSQSCLKLNDVIGFWRVEDLEENRKLLLRAEMKLPGRAWLEFNVNPAMKENILSVTAYFEHRGLWGRIYWYIFVPFHAILFKNLLKAIAERS